MSIQQFPASDGRFNPTEVLTDPVNKLRTSTAQALIDTPEEYARLSEACGGEVKKLAK